MPAQYGLTCQGLRCYRLSSALRFLQMQSQYLSVALKHVVTSGWLASTTPLQGKRNTLVGHGAVPGAARWQRSCPLFMEPWVRRVRPEDQMRPRSAAGVTPSLRQQMLLIPACRRWAVFSTGRRFSKRRHSFLARGPGALCHLVFRCCCATDCFILSLLTAKLQMKLGELLPRLLDCSTEVIVLKEPPKIRPNSPYDLCSRFAAVMESIHGASTVTVK